MSCFPDHYHDLYGFVCTVARWWTTWPLKDEYLNCTRSSLMQNLLLSDNSSPAEVELRAGPNSLASQMGPE
jgi:hypothetical protein